MIEFQAHWLRLQDWDRIKKIAGLIVAAIIALWFLTSCGEKEVQARHHGRQATHRMNNIQVTSSAFDNGDPIPTKYTCKGKNVSPPLSWSSVPEGTKSLAMIVDDPDAPRKTWVHWVIYNIPGDETMLEENIPGKRELSDGTRQGTNDFPKIGYGGPCPPSGNHRYFFKIHALDTVLDLKPGATKQELIQAMKGNIIGGGQLMGTFSAE